MQKITVVTLNLASDESSVVVIDHDDFEMRKWLGRHSFWCVRNERLVSIAPALDTEAITFSYTLPGAQGLEPGKRWTPENHNA